MHNRILINSPRLWRGEWPQLKSNSHKYTRGRIIVFGGEMTGAARLAAMAAARMGAGLVTLLAPQELWPVYSAATPAHILVRAYASLNDAKTWIENDKSHAFVIGPGFGSAKLLSELIDAVLKTGKPVVLDADALTIFAGDAGRLLNALHENCILTPHEGEWRKLFGALNNRLADIQAKAAAYQAVFLMKGPETLIAQQQKLIKNMEAPPTLATGGSGDVLSGMIGGLIAQGMKPFEAAAAAAWCHGKAAKNFGAGLVASDLIEMLPHVIQKFTRA